VSSLVLSREFNRVLAQHLCNSSTHRPSSTVVQVVGAVIVDQGTCSFATKAWHAQSAGASMVIIQALGDGTAYPCSSLCSHSRALTLWRRPRRT
jgi:hypothetical protein